MDGQRRAQATHPRRIAACALAGLLAACTTQPPVPLEPLLPAPPPPLVSRSCMSCLDQSDEIARLREALAAREAELRDLRASQREQARVVAESSRDVAQAKARQRRLATKADAASAIAEAEVEQQAAREKLPAPPPPALFALATRSLDAATTAFSRQEFGAAVDRASEAQVLFAAVVAATESSGSKAPPDVLLRGGVPLRAASRAPLRRQPAGPVTGNVAADAPLTALAWRAGYLRVLTGSGATGWIAEGQVALR